MVYSRDFQRVEDYPLPSRGMRDLSNARLRRFVVAKTASTMHYWMETGLVDQPRGYVSSRAC